ncbi:MAG: hypothetical protein MUC65_09665, partial [Pontiellaceae bacterium]|nr:hypothetical protein [Pontiellaceae bacterium]
MKTIKSVLKTRRQGTRLIAAVFLLLAVSLQAAVITNITQLDSAAVFHFAIMSDNKGDSPSNSSHMQRCDTWVKNSGGIASAFVIGLGDHTVSTSSTNDPILRFIRNDSYWKTKFYPGIADGENQSFGGSQGAWGKGYHLFEYVDNFFGRSNVTFRPLTSDPDDRQVDYYAKVTVSGYNVHILNLHFADQYDGRMGGSNPFVEATQAYMQSKLEALAAAGKTDHDIIIVLAHSTGGDFVEQGNINSTRKDLLLCTADLCVSATTHRYGWWDRYKTYDNGNGAVSYNSGSVGHAGGHPDKPAEDGVQGYMELHVLENPPRMTIQYIKTELSSRTLHVGKYSDFNSYDSAKYGTPVIKQINGPWGVVDWNNLPLGTTGTNGASYVSQTVPTNMVAGTVSN